ncbi:unnamed protein product [Meganyctiphanes norvegica]|uniref:Cuticle protein n=1 Tax=Meganyctiphanes norvegica TaxID=48144 RepID=A0AAV2R3H8_MEGNR
MKQSLVLFSALCSLSAAALVPIPYSRGAHVVFTESKAPNFEKIPAPGIKVFNNVRIAAPAPVVYSAPAPVVQAAPAVYSAPVPAVYSAPVPVVQAAPAVYSAPAPVVQAAPAVYSAPAPAVYPAPVVVAEAPSPLDAPNPPMPSLDIPHRGGQYHAQDELGQYAFGHYGGPNTRVESKDYLGRVTGSFGYIDGKGDVQVRKYAAAPGMGTKVAGSDIPVDPNH